MACSSPLGRGDLDDIELPETGTDGTYGFTIHADALADECQPVLRESVLSVTIDTDVDPLDSVVVVVDPGDGTYVVTVPPYDDFGNFIGPGFADSVTVNTTSILVPSSSVDDGLDGSYTHNLGGAQFALRYAQPSCRYSHWNGRCPSRKLAWASNITPVKASLTLRWPAQAVTRDRLSNW
ncbi:MAG: hypothetical protein CL709_04065 [Chloroflexi bacterium]|nr:hypothetical protein [Chloroflexota bacterium]